MVAKEVGGGEREREREREMRGRCCCHWCGSGGERERDREMVAMVKREGERGERTSLLSLMVVVMVERLRENVCVYVCGYMQKGNEIMRVKQ